MFRSIECSRLGRVREFRRMLLLATGRDVRCNGVTQMVEATSLSDVVWMLSDAALIRLDDVESRYDPGRCKTHKTHRSRLPGTTVNRSRHRVAALAFGVPRASQMSLNSRTLPRRLR